MVGSIGAGKSTLLKILAGIAAPSWTLPLTSSISTKNDGTEKRISGRIERSARRAEFVIYPCA